MLIEKEENNMFLSKYLNDVYLSMLYENYEEEYKSFYIVDDCWCNMRHGFGFTACKCKC